jgi:ankyrin repeat protein
VEFLLAKGVPITVCDRQRQTGLHWAVIGAHPEIVKLLLRHHAPLETTNSYGGTVYGQAIYSGASPEILEILKAAGAKVIP